ncbi:(2E,6E)-farnesyl diphosphate synthase [Thiohalomonas denitrificans]|uniref:Farnesyl-diphosphate synthase n=1 Tax=Thiohalomonas denitrificans TaxID=415747 RepID=A0A1G5PZS2_9GAMM|nr:farnesyl diphosphate synthase [Thiohalomonas denitrificans]SCZ55094.1 farnesyl-diphosphate synthase [Thiohalomonas denitrificans]
MAVEQLLEDYRERAEKVLEKSLPSANDLPGYLHEAMRYAALGGGKRVRAVLVYAAGQAVGTAPAELDAPAAAIELIHAYSLVHDDLPAMDDDDLRRGKPTCHKAFGEATAILVGDALQSLAFEVLAEQDSVNATIPMAMIRELASAAGSRGMCGGQAIDMEAVGQQLTLEQLETMHAYKTGALIRAGVRLGVLSQPTTVPETLERLDDYARAVGLAFQIRDDILDVVADTETLGKPQGSDAARRKPTYTALLGLEGAREKTRALHRRALDDLKPFGPSADPLRALADYIVKRAN